MSRLPLHSTSGNKSFVILYLYSYSVVVRAAEVVAAMRADQLAFVSGEAVRTIGADLAVVIDRGIIGSLDSLRARRTTLWEIAGKFVVENAGSAGEHG